MTTRILFVAAALTALMSLPAAAQTAQPKAAAKPAPAQNAQPQVDPKAAVETTQRLADEARRAAAPKGQLVNIRVDVVLSDQRGSEPPSKRTISVVSADGMFGRVRSQSNVSGIGNVPLNVDASPEILPNGKIRLGFNLQYDGPGSSDAIKGEVPFNPMNVPRGTVMSTSINQQMSLIVESGKAMVIAQSADPIGDRHVTVEVTATILK